jgi:hypothetical protein
MTAKGVKLIWQCIFFDNPKFTIFNLFVYLLIGNLMSPFKNFVVINECLINALNMSIYYRIRGIHGDD